MLVEGLNIASSLCGIVAFILFVLALYGYVLAHEESASILEWKKAAQKAILAAALYGMNGGLEEIANRFV